MAQRKLFLWFETSGIHIPDWQGLPTNFDSLFDVVVIIVANQMNTDSPTPTQELAAFRSVEALLPPNMMSERWVSLAFGDDGYLTSCRHDSSDPSVCTPALRDYLSKYKNWPGWGEKGGLAGVAFDDEWGRSISRLKTS